MTSDRIADAALQASLDRIAAHLEDSAGRLLTQWRARVLADSALPGASQWNLRQFYNHFPDVLQVFIRQLRAGAAPVAHAECAAEHVRHRWLQAYALRDVLREWGHLNAAMVDELHGCCASAGTDGTGAALRAWTQLFAQHLTETAEEYHHLLQAEALTRAQALRTTVERLRGRTLADWVHSMRDELSVLQASAALLGARDGDGEVSELHELSRSGTAALDRALSEMAGLAHLEAGLVARLLSTLDAGALLGELCASKGVACEGPEHFDVETDAGHLQAVATRLLALAPREARSDGARLSWGPDPRSDARWCLQLRHSVASPPTAASPAAARVSDATRDARRSEGAPVADRASALPQAGDTPVAGGIGFLILKRVCELLDARWRWTAARPACATW